MALAHKSVAVRPEVWRKLRINAELSGVSVRDYLSYLVERSFPIDAKDAGACALLQSLSLANQRARDGVEPVDAAQ